MVSLLDIVPTVLDWFSIPYPHYSIAKHHKTVQLTGKSLIPTLVKEPHKYWDTVFASHNLHEVTMYYPMRVIRNRSFKLIHNLNYRMPFPIDQDLYISPTFQDVLTRTRKHEDLHWDKTLMAYYYRDPWELYRIDRDQKELKNLAADPDYTQVLADLQKQLYDWQNITSDPWLCSPTAVLEDAGAYKTNPTCMSMDNNLK